MLKSLINQGSLELTHCSPKENLTYNVCDIRIELLEFTQIWRDLGLEDPQLELILPVQADGSALAEMINNLEKKMQKASKNLESRLGKQMQKNQQRRGVKIEEHPDVPPVLRQKIRQGHAGLEKRILND